MISGDSSATDGARLLGLLQDLDQRIRMHALGLPQQLEERQWWEGVVFDVGGTRLVTALDEVAEVLNYPDNVTSVPGAQPWMRGIANIRGNLLPIADLQAFLGGPVTMIGRRSRILVFNQGDGLIGLLIGEMVATRHFDEANRTGKAEAPGGAAPYVAFGFEEDGAYWPVFSVKTLAKSEGFQRAAR